MEDKPYEDSYFEDLEINPDIEVITSNQFDLSALFHGGGLKQVKYYMDFVPLKLGVKINTD